ncbi:hypothetical protein Tco_0323726 [Tanacetum coccineum]
MEPNLSIRTLCELYENVGISIKTLSSHSLNKTYVVERQIRLFVVASRTILIFSKVPPIFLRAEATLQLLPPQKPFFVIRLLQQNPYELMQLLFDELLTPSPSVDHPAPEVIAPIAEVVAPEPAASIGSPSSTIVNQDKPSPNVVHMNNDLFFCIPIPKNDSEASSSSDVIPAVVQTAALNSEHVTKWTKDHPLDNIIGELKRPVSTRL